MILWTTADYKIPENQEPALSEHFENLLISMTQSDADARPDAKKVLQVLTGVWVNLMVVLDLMVFSSHLIICNSCYIFI